MKRGNSNDMKSKNVSIKSVLESHTLLYTTSCYLHIINFKVFFYIPPLYTGMY